MKPVKLATVVRQVKLAILKQLVEPAKPVALVKLEKLANFERSRSW